MSADLTFGDISALFGLTNHIIDQQRYTILLTAVMQLIGRASCRLRPGRTPRRDCWS
jgi:hypothetical protein